MDKTPFRPFMDLEELKAHQSSAMYTRTPPEGLPGEVVGAWAKGTRDPKELTKLMRVSQRQVEWILDHNAPGWRWLLVSEPLQGKAAAIVKLADESALGAVEIARATGSSRQYVHKVLRRFRPDYAIRVYRRRSSERTPPRKVTRQALRLEQYPSRHLG